MFTLVHSCAVTQSKGSAGACRIKPAWQQLRTWLVGHSACTAHATALRRLTISSRSTSAKRFQPKMASSHAHSCLFMEQNTQLHLASDRATTPYQQVKQTRQHRASAHHRSGWTGASRCPPAAGSCRSCGPHASD